MKIKNLYSPEVLKMFRVFATVGIIAELFYLYTQFSYMNFHFNWSAIHSIDAFFTSREGLIISNFLCLIIFITLLFVPQCIEFVAIIAFYFSFIYMLNPSLEKKPLGNALYVLGVSSLVIRGLFRKHTRIKVYITIIVYCSLILSNLRFGFDTFIDSFLDSLGYILAYGISMVFFVHFLRSVHMSKIMKIWDLSQYSDLTERDKQWLTDILNDKKYEDIAKESGITIGTLKNRMHQIFTIIGVPDKVSLLATYGGYEIKF